MIIDDIKNKAAKNAYKIIYDGIYKDYLNIYQTLKIGFLNLEDIRKITEGGFTPDAIDYIFGFKYKKISFEHKCLHAIDEKRYHRATRNKVSFEL